MRAYIARVVLGLAALSAGVYFSMLPAVPDVQADAPVNRLDVAQVTCLPASLIDGGAGGTALACGTGYLAVKAQNNTTTAVYFGGGTNFTATNVTYGQKHCDGCADGPAFVAGVYQGKARCMTVGDAGAVVQLICGR
jgi:hypothetical protein